MPLHNSAERTVIPVPNGSAYNSYLINILLLGVYTAIYFGALYIYLSSKASRSPVVISSLTALYLLNAEQTAIQWSWTTSFFKMAAGPKHEVFVDTNIQSNWNFLLTTVNAFLSAAVADSLLIWRCYNVWNRSFRVILVPLALLLVETGTCVANIVQISTALLNPDIYNSSVGLRIQTSLAIFSTFAQTLVTTSLILYRIVTASRHINPPTKTDRTYRDIIDLIIQSSALYSVALLIWSISWAATVSDTLRSVMLEICFNAAGIVPTLMVARIARVSSKDVYHQNLAAQISDIEFQATPADATISVPVADRTELASKSD